ncbi:MAG: inositol monophosphatase [Lachnospiraceae bacterium]|nr:inositol monophosphatase [Lachnospiraceae bacterium]
MSDFHDEAFGSSEKKTHSDSRDSMRTINSADSVKPNDFVYSVKPDGSVFSADSVNFEEVLAVVRETGGLFRDDTAAGHVTVKGRSDYVTEVDLAVQQTLYQRLTARYPDIQFMGEEKDNAAIDFDRPVWILDPVDGTTNLIHHFPASCIALALYIRPVVEVGIIYNPWREELFFARRGHGAFLNGAPIHVKDAATLSESLVSVGTTPYSHEYADGVFRQIKNVFLRAQDIRRIGSAELDLAYVACGRTDAYFEQYLKPWDFAAGMCIVEEAGGRVTDYEGNPLSPESPRDVLATNGCIHDETIQVLAL